MPTAWPQSSVSARSHLADWREIEVVLREIPLKPPVSEPMAYDEVAGDPATCPGALLRGGYGFAVQQATLPSRLLVPPSVAEAPSAKPVSACPRSTAAPTAPLLVQQALFYLAERRSSAVNLLARSLPLLPR